MGPIHVGVKRCTENNPSKYCFFVSLLSSPHIPRQPTLLTTKTVETNRRELGVDTCLEQLATDPPDPWQVVPRQVFTPNDCLLISVVFVVLCRVCFLWETGVLCNRWHVCSE